MGFLQTGVQVHCVLLSLYGKGAQHLLVHLARKNPSNIINVAYLYGIDLVVIQGKNGLLVVLEGAGDIPVSTITRSICPRRSWSRASFWLPVIPA